MSGVHPGMRELNRSTPIPSAGTRPLFPSFGYATESNVYSSAKEMSVGVDTSGFCFRTNTASACNI